MQMQVMIKTTCGGASTTIGTGGSSTCYNDRHDHGYHTTSGLTYAWTSSPAGFTSASCYPQV